MNPYHREVHFDLEISNSFIPAIPTEKLVENRGEDMINYLKASSATASSQNFT